jgi:hypothetical protein
MPLPKAGYLNLVFVMYRVQLKGADKFWARVLHTKTKKKKLFILYPIDPLLGNDWINMFPRRHILGKHPVAT